MYKAIVYITLKPTVLDPQGQAVKHSLSALGYEGVKDVRIGKFMEIFFEGESIEEARDKVKEMCDRFLANPVIEDFHFEVEQL
jgi:phosphoribosylformylglycinamidine synthase